MYIVFINNFFLLKFITVQDAYGLAISALVMVLLLLLGWILRSILSHFGIECRAPVRRGRGSRSDVENPQPRTEETRPKERVCTEVNLSDCNNKKER